MDERVTSDAEPTVPDGRLNRFGTTGGRKLLEGRTAVVTGSSRGIGRAIALALAENGANVAINYNRSHHAGEEVLAEAKALGARACLVQADVTRMEDVRRLRDTVHEALGPVDVLVNNAGVNVDVPFRRMSDESWHRVVDTNMTAVYNVTKTFLDDLTRREGGRVVNVSSFSALKANYGQTNYAASKGAILSFTKTLSVELARDAVTVNAVAPGLIETDMFQGVPDRIKDKLLEQIPAHRFGRPEEVAHAVVFLASPMAAYITGTVVHVNGGLYMG